MNFIRKFMLGVDKTNIFIGKVMVYVSVFAIAVITFEVVMRYLFNRPTNWGHELMTLLFAIQYCMAAGYAHYHRAHVRVDVLYSSRSLRTRAYLDLFTSIFFFSFTGVLLWTCWDLLLEFSDDDSRCGNIRDTDSRRAILHGLGPGLLSGEIHDAFRRLHAPLAGHCMVHP